MEWISELERIKASRVVQHTRSFVVIACLPSEDEKLFFKLETMAAKMKMEIFAWKIKQ